MAEARDLLIHSGPSSRESPEEDEVQFDLTVVGATPPMAAADEDRGRRPDVAREQSWDSVVSKGKAELTIVAHTRYACSSK